MSENENDPLHELGPLPVLEPAEEAALGEALRAAFAPAAIAPERHQQLLARALEDPFAPASEDELRASERLRQALDRGDDAHPEAALARALRAAMEPQPLPTSARQRAAELVRAAATREAKPARSNLVFVTFGSVALAAAAGFALLLTRPSAEPVARSAASASAAAALAPIALSRTTGDLFRERFEAGETTARIDRITSARERDLRENRYALWGVR